MVYMLPTHGMRPGNPMKNVAKQHQSVGSRKDQPVGRPGLYPPSISHRWFLWEPIRGANFWGAVGAQRSTDVLVPNKCANGLLIPRNSLSMPQSVREFEQDPAVVNGKTLGS